MALSLYKWMGLLLVPVLMGSRSKPVADAAVHPFYISVTEVSHNTTDKALEISCKFFMDDFEAVLEKAYKATLDITVDKYKPSFDKYIADYIPKRLAFTIDGKAVALTYVGYETEKESAYAYFEIKNVSSAKAVQITNSLLHDFTAQQINIMHLTIGGKRQSTKLNHPDTKATFSF